MTLRMLLPGIVTQYNIFEDDVNRHNMRMMLPGRVTQYNIIEDDVTRHNIGDDVTLPNIEDDATSLIWFALAWFLTDVILLFSKGAKYSNYQGSIPDELLFC